MLKPDKQRKLKKPENLKSRFFKTCKKRAGENVRIPAATLLDF